MSQMTRQIKETTTGVGLPDFVSLGEHSYFADLLFQRWGKETIKIGKYCSISQQVKILAGGNHRTDTVSTYPFDTMFDVLKPGTVDRSYVCNPLFPQDIVIGNDVWIGWGATISGSLTIGDGAVIAGGAQVFTDIPAYAIAVGNPAKVMKYRFNEEVVESLLEIAWWNWPDEYLRRRIDRFYLPVEEFINKCMAERTCVLGGRA